VKKILKEGARGGGMFIGSSSEIVPATPLENIHAFYEACKEFGRYRWGSDPRLFRVGAAVSDAR